MELVTNHVVFSLADLTQSANSILSAGPDAIVAFRLLRDVLRLPSNSTELIKARQAALESKWVSLLVGSQLPDGSWGRFHSQDTKVKAVFRTTEEAIDRAFALGLEPQEDPLRRAQDYILNVLLGNTHITDREEKSESWPLLIRFILAGRLAQVDPGNKALSLFWIFLEEVADRAFASGEYSLDDEAAAFMDLSGIRVPKGFLESQHALWVLSAHRLPDRLEEAVVRWIWQKPDGMRYLRAPLAEFEPRQVGYWFRSMNILSRFPSWREICLGTVNRLWEMRGRDGWWEFGRDIARCSDFPISDNWRNQINRKLDYSTSTLVLLRKWFD